MVFRYFFFTRNDHRFPIKNYYLLFVIGIIKTREKKINNKQKTKQNKAKKHWTQNFFLLFSIFSKEFLFWNTRIHFYIFSLAPKKKKKTTAKLNEENKKKKKKKIQKWNDTTTRKTRNHFIVVVFVCLFHEQWWNVPENNKFPSI